MQHTDTIEQAGGAVAIITGTGGIAAFFADINPILVGISLLVSIIVGGVTIYYKVRSNGRN